MQLKNQTLKSAAIKLLEVYFYLVDNRSTIGTDHKEKEIKSILLKSYSNIPDLDVARKINDHQSNPNMVQAGSMAETISFSSDAYLDKKKEGSGLKNVVGNNLTKFPLERPVKEEPVHIDVSEIDEELLLLELSEASESELLKRFKDYKGLQDFSKEKFNVTLPAKKELGVKKFKETVDQKLKQIDESNADKS